MTVMYLVLSAVLVALLLRLLKKPISLRAKTKIDKAAGICMAASAVLLALPLPFSGAATTIVGSVLGGAGVAWTYMRWGEFYSELDIHYAAPLIFVSMALGSFFKTFVDIAPPVVATIILVCMPFVAYATLYQSVKTTPQSSEPFRYYNDRTAGSLWRLALGVAVFSVTVGIIQSMPLTNDPALREVSALSLHGGEIVLALATFFWIVRMKRGLSFSRAWCLVLLLMATALIFAPYLAEILGGNLFASIGIAQTFIIILLFLALGDIARHSSFPPMMVFAAGWVAYVLPFSVGDVFGTSMQSFEPIASIIMAVIVWILVVVTLFFLDESSVGKHLIFTELNDGGEDDTTAKRLGAMQETLDEPSLSDMLALRCAALAEELHLTPREHEILELLARGRSKTYIADAFFISENTVRGHVKRLYVKLDVHSKQELVDKVESTEPRS